MAKPSMPEMVEKRFSILDEIERLKEDMAKLDLDLIASMKKSKIKETPFFKDRAFRLNTEKSCEYKEEAYALAKKKKVIGLFTPKPKITPTKIATAYKKELIDLETFQALESAAINHKTSETLVKFEVKP